ncbi:hypothetical protein ACFQHV_19230 [Promicromonospora thailandica]|uniref:Uncharacterized protein n=1 Tax=Promicromonospora thailandica TaxID=765201 RepID=A0A9X2G5I8_9MICO|nr:hypothetical protein [Promicromonospora thailandica]MCP2262916.1 hypothetical protein [Promicromonospora thailandica]BFF18265.1 hypothetical protein GCM10025730_17860 [Promicromonospora thailandica]
MEYDDGVDEHDTPAEVDAAFRTLRRVAITHVVLFLVAVLGVPALSLTLGWWSDGQLAGGMSPGFAMAAFGLYAFFLVIGLAAASLSSAVEARMLGGRHTGEDDGFPADGDRS